MGKQPYFFAAGFLVVAALPVVFLAAGFLAGAFFTAADLRAAELGGGVFGRVMKEVSAFGWPREAAL